MSHCSVYDNSHDEFYTTILGTQVQGSSEASMFCPVNPLEANSRQEIDIEKLYNYNNILTLVKLAKPANLTDFVNTICLPESDEQVPDGTNLVRLGWGFRNTTFDALSIYQTLRQSVVPFINQSDCIKAYADSPQNLDHTRMCSGKVPQKNENCEVNILISEDIFSKPFVWRKRGF